MVDGYDELPEEFQEKIKFALEHNHIPDEDCTRVSTDRYRLVHLLTNLGT